METCTGPRSIGTRCGSGRAGCKNGDTVLEKILRFCKSTLLPEEPEDLIEEVVQQAGFHTHCLVQQCRCVSGTFFI